MGDPMRKRKLFQLVVVVLSACLLISGMINVNPVNASNGSQSTFDSIPQKSIDLPRFDDSILYVDSALFSDQFQDEPNGSNCSSPTVFDDHWSEGYRLVCQNNLYVLMVDLTNPAIKVEVVAAPRGLQSVSSFADSNTIAIINADYNFYSSTNATECNSNICSNGLTISNGSNPTTYTNVSHLCSDARVRREIGFSEDGRVVIDWWYKFVSDSQARAWCGSIQEGGGGQEGYRYNLVGGGPQFTFDGQFRWDCQYGMDANHNCLDSGGDVGINGEHFGRGNWWARYQSAVGYSSDGQVLVIAESNNQTHTMQEVHDILYQRLQAYGKTLKNAFKFDGGSKAGFWYYNHTFDSTPGVTVPNVIRVQRTNSTCYNLTTNISPGGSGNINVQTGSNCAQGKYRPGTNVTLSASPNSGYNFNNWSGDASGSSSTTTITMNGNKNITANFSTIQTCFSVTPNVNPGGSGTINITPGPNCNGSQYISGTNIQLNAIPNQGYSFSNWSGDVTGISSATSLIVNGNKNITANFSVNPTCYSLDMSISPINSGNITRSPAPNCNGTQYSSGTNVQLSAIPNSGYVFSNWAGGVSGNANPTWITMNSTKSVTANFSFIPINNHRVYLPLVMSIRGIENGNFELGDTGWEQFSTHSWQLILNASGLPILPHSGNYAVWLGGDNDETSIISQHIYINPATPYLSFYYVIGSSEVGCDWDKASVQINNVSLKQYGLCESNNSDTWIYQIIDLRSYSSQTVELKFTLTTDSTNNSNMFIDDVTLQTTSSNAGEVLENAETSDLSGAKVKRQ